MTDLYDGPNKYNEDGKDNQNNEDDS